MAIFRNIKVQFIHKSLIKVDYNTGEYAIIDNSDAEKFQQYNKIFDKSLTEKQLVSEDYFSNESRQLSFRYPVKSDYSWIGTYLLNSLNTTQVGNEVYSDYCVKLIDVVTEDNVVAENELFFGVLVYPRRERMMGKDNYLLQAYDFLGLLGDYLEVDRPLVYQVQGQPINGVPDTDVDGKYINEDQNDIQWNTNNREIWFGSYDFYSFRANFISPKSGAEEEFVAVKYTDSTEKTNQFKANDEIYAFNSKRANNWVKSVDENNYYLLLMSGVFYTSYDTALASSIMTAFFYSGQGIENVSTDDYIYIYGCTNPENNGIFKVGQVDSSGLFVRYYNPKIIDNSKDETEPAGDRDIVGMFGSYQKYEIDFDGGEDYDFLIAGTKVDGGSFGLIKSHRTGDVAPDPTGNATKDAIFNTINNMPFTLQEWFGSLYYTAITDYWGGYKVDTDNRLGFNAKYTADFVFGSLKYTDIPIESYDMYDIKNSKVKGDSDGLSSQKEAYNLILWDNNGTVRITLWKAKYGIANGVGYYSINTWAYSIVAGIGVRFIDKDRFLASTFPETSVTWDQFGDTVNEHLQSYHGLPEGTILDNYANELPDDASFMGDNSITVGDATYNIRKVDWDGIEPLDMDRDEPFVVRLYATLDSGFNSLTFNEGRYSLKKINQFFLYLNDFVQYVDNSGNVTTSTKMSASAPAFESNKNALFNIPNSDIEKVSVSKVLRGEIDIDINEYIAGLSTEQIENVGEVSQVEKDINDYYNSVFNASFVKAEIDIINLTNNYDIELADVLILDDNYTGTSDAWYVTKVDDSEKNSDGVIKIEGYKTRFFALDNIDQVSANELVFYFKTYNSGTYIYEKYEDNVLIATAELSVGYNDLIVSNNSLGSPLLGTYTHKVYMKDEEYIVAEASITIEEVV